MKIDMNFVKDSYKNTEVVQAYVKKEKEYGVSSIEKKIIFEYVNQENKILDVGCGTGRVSFGLYEQGYRKITGIDISEEMIKEAKAIREKNQSDVNFEVQNLLELQFEKGSFDAVMAFHAITPIPQIENRKKALIEIRKILKHEGIIIISTFLQNPEDEFWLKEKENWEKGLQDKSLNDFGDIIRSKENSAKIFIHIPSEEDFKNLLQETGYELLEHYSWKELSDSEEEIASAQKCEYWVAKLIKQH